MTRFLQTMLLACVVGVGWGDVTVDDKLDAIHVYVLKAKAYESLLRECLEYLDDPDELISSTLMYQTWESRQLELIQSVKAEANLKQRILEVLGDAE